MGILSLPLSEDYLARFGGISRLYGRSALERFHGAHICVIGVGGVGSWLVESLARSGIGELTLIDLDDVCVTNVNRQLPALDGTIGRPKVEVLAERVRAINPGCQVHAITEFLTPTNADRLIHESFSYVVDCVDRMSIKLTIILRSKKLGVPILTMGGAGGRKDPLRVKLLDINRTAGDRLLKQVRKKLRTEHRFPADQKKKHGVLAVVSDEAQTFPWADGSCRATAEPGENLRMDCASGYGSATHVTATFALVGTGAVLDHLAQSPTP